MQRLLSNMYPTAFLAAYEQKFCLLHKKGSQIWIEQLGYLHKNVKRLDMDPKQEAIFVTGMPSESIVLRKIQLAIRAKKEVLSLLPFQMENFIPFSSEELIVCPLLLQKKANTDVVVLATLQKSLEKHIQEQGDPDIVCCVPTALYRYARYFYPEKESLFLCHGNTLIAIKDKELEGCVSFTNDNSSSHCFTRAIAFLQKKYPDIEPNIVQSGPHWNFAIPLGLALDAASHDAYSTQFRPLSTPSAPEKRRNRKRWTVFFSLCCLFTIFVSLFGTIQLQYKERKLLQNVEMSSELSLETAVKRLAKEIDLAKKGTIPISSLPKICELLSWLSKHPKLQQGCSINRLEYDLQMPKQASKEKPSSAKLQLHLLIQNPSQAREFHETLLTEKRYIDHKKGISWTGDHGIYQVSFYIKAAV